MRRDLLLAVMCAGFSCMTSGLAGRPCCPHATRHDPAQCVIARIPAPPGYAYVRGDGRGFFEWLCHLPLKPRGCPVCLYNGRLKRNQSAHFAVVDRDLERENLQQCADAVIRLRAEYLYSVGRYSDIHFNFTSGHRADFLKWAGGYRPRVAGNRIRWVKKAPPDRSRDGLRAYLRTVFCYAGTRSLAGELEPVAGRRPIEPGDAFVRPGSPGHAAIVVAVAVSERTRKRVFLLAQSFMPAQDIHILKNPMNTAISPWYQADFGERLVTPEWVFRRDERRGWAPNWRPATGRAR